MEAFLPTMMLVQQAPTRCSFSSCATVLRPISIRADKSNDLNLSILVIIDNDCPFGSPKIEKKTVSNGNQLNIFMELLL